MADDYDVMLVIPETEAKALAKLVARIDYGTCVKLSAPCTTYGARPECDVMWCALQILQRQLTDNLGGV
jgi:hypothetical protein